MALDRNRLIKPLKKLQKLVKKLDDQPTPEQVHDLRTNTRRFEAIFEAFSRCKSVVRKSTLKSLTRFRRRAGRIRDMDVLTSYASTVHPTGEDECAVQLLEHLGAERRKHAKRLYAALKQRRPEVRAELKKMPAVILNRIENNGDNSKKRMRSPNATAIALTLASQLGDPPRLSRANLHSYRLKVKQLRNVLQMADSPKAPKFIDDLGEVKDAIGEWHDWEELISIAEKVLDHGRKRCKLLAELKRASERKYEHAFALVQTLRKTYLRNSDASRKGAHTVAAQTPREPVWEAIATLIQ